MFTKKVSLLQLLKIIIIISREKVMQILYCLNVTRGF